MVWVFFIIAKDVFEYGPLKRILSNLKNQHMPLFFYVSFNVTFATINNNFIKLKKVFFSGITEC